MDATFWTLLPPIIAVALALATKEVYTSLIAGIFTGAMLLTGFRFVPAFQTALAILGQKVGENANILVFLALLGMLASLMEKAGGTQAYGKRKERIICTRRGVQAMSFLMGALIFVDDYFNCLTVGTIMGPLADRKGLSRVKLAYIIDATAAPVCILAPISSWAAAVTTAIPDGSAIDGFQLFLQTIPVNLYAWLTLFMVLFLICLDFDFGKMRSFCVRAASAEVNREKMRDCTIKDANASGRLRYIGLPIGCLMVCSVGAMLITGGILKGKGIAAALSGCDASLSLVFGAVCALLFTAILYLPRKVIRAKEWIASLVTGTQSMVPAILILTLAWTLSGLCSPDYLNTGGYVARLLDATFLPLWVLPALFYLAALGLSFSTGTSWGTFLILVPIAVTVLQQQPGPMLVLSVAGLLSGAVCGDHISPISDTTILASVGAGCGHLEHVTTQLPYALLVASCCLPGFLLAGFMQNGWLGFLLSCMLLICFLLYFYFRQRCAKPFSKKGRGA